MRSLIAISAALPENVLPLGRAPLMDWAVNALPGDRAIYWQGHLARDCWPAAERLPTPLRRALAETARLALRLSDDGYVHLVQHRLGTHDYVYVAVARRRATVRRRPTLSTVIPQEAA